MRENNKNKGFRFSALMEEEEYGNTYTNVQQERMEEPPNIDKGQPCSTKQTMEATKEVQRKDKKNTQVSQKKKQGKIGGKKGVNMTESLKILSKGIGKEKTKGGTRNKNLHNLGRLVINIEVGETLSDY